MKSDRARLLAAFKALRRRGYVADGPLGNTPSDGWTDVYDASGDPESPAVFFTTETGRAFKGDTLSRKLPLFWRGDPKLIVETLGKHGFKASIPTDDEAITIVAGPATKWPATRAAAPAPTTDALGAALAAIDAKLAALAAKGWKVVWKPRAFYYSGSPPAKTISIEAPSLAKVPAQLKQRAKGFAEPTYRLSLYVRKADRKTIAAALRGTKLKVELGVLSDCGIDIVLPAPGKR